MLSLEEASFAQPGEDFPISLAEVKLVRKRLTDKLFAVNI